MLNLTDEGRVRIAALNRPEALNAFNKRQFDEVAEAFLSARADANCRVLILTGTGRAFSAGADLGPTTDYEPVHGLDGMLAAIVDFPKPFVLAINGLGVGIGATLAGLADFVFMAESARLRCPFSTLGLVAEAGSTRTFPALLGRQRAMWFLMASEWMSAAQCKEAGLALDVFPDDGFMAAVGEKAGHLAGMPPESLASAKRLIVDADERERLKTVISAENTALAKLSGGPANREAVTAFREKREADFSNL